MLKTIIEYRKIFFISILVFFVLSMLNCKDEKQEARDCIKKYNILILEDPSIAMNYTTRARCYSLLNEYDMAIEDLKKAISIYEKNSDYYYLSMIYLAKGMFEEAKWAIDNAIRLKSDHENYYFIRAYCFDYLSQKDESIKDYTRFLTYHRKVELLKWEHYFSYIRRAILFMEKSDYQSAMKDINSAIKIDGTGDDIYYLKFMIEAKSGEYDNSYEDLKKALLNGFNDRAELEEFVMSVPFINQNKVIEITDKYMKTKKPINGFDYYNWDYIIKKSFDIKE